MGAGILGPEHPQRAIYAGSVQLVFPGGRRERDLHAGFEISRRRADLLGLPRRTAYLWRDDPRRVLSAAIDGRGAWRRGCRAPFRVRRKANCNPSSTAQTMPAEAGS